jgi:hypothetical protein
MRTTWMVLASLAALVLAWALLRPRGASEVPPEEPPRDERESRAPPAREGSPSLPAVPAPAPPPATGPTRRAPLPPIEGKGGLLVVPLPVQGQPIPDDLRLDLEFVGGRLHAQPLSLALEDGTHRYEGLPPGGYRVRLFSDVLIDSVAEAKVRDGEETRVEVQLVPGSHAHVKVTLFSGEAPAEVSYTLKDRKGMPVEARYEGRSPDARRSPRVGKTVKMPADVVVSGFRGGQYTLRATTPADEYEEETFQVRPGQGATIALKIRK